MSLALITGFCPSYAQAQPLTLFVAIVFVFIADICSHSVNPVKIISVLIVFVLCLNMTKSINNYAVDNYERFEYETNMLNDVGRELLNFSISEKSVVFVSKEDDILPDTFTVKESVHPAVSAYQKIVFSVFDSILPDKFFKQMSGYYGEDISDSYELANSINFSQRGYKSFISRTMWKGEFEPDVYKAMRRLGYNINACTQEEHFQAEKLMAENDPKKRYTINEYDTIIIVQFMSIN